MLLLLLLPWVWLLCSMAFRICKITPSNDSSSRGLLETQTPAELLDPDDEGKDENEEDEDEGEQAGNHHQLKAGKETGRAAWRPQVGNLIRGRHQRGRHAGAGALTVEHEAAGALLLLLAGAGAGRLVPGPARVQAGLLGGQVSALAGAELGSERLPSRTVAGGQLAGAGALDMLLHLQAGALLGAETGLDAAAGQDDGDRGAGCAGGLAAVAILVAATLTPPHRHVGGGHLK